MSAEIRIDDDGFVRAPTPLVYQRLTHVKAWPTWWPGLQVRPHPVDTDAEVVALDLVGAAGRVLRLVAELHGWRHDAGFQLALSGDLQGDAEFWLEPGYGGTIVHHIVGARTSHPRPLSVHADYRRVLRRGLWALKDLLELEVRTSAGLVP